MGSITINFTNANAVRLGNALQEKLSLEKRATEAQLKQYVIDFLKNLVRTSEAREAVKAVEVAENDVSIT